MKPIPGEGDPVTLAEARISTYPDGIMIVTSTPTEGSVDVEKHAETGVEHWAVADTDDLGSQVWRLFQEGTRHEWAVPCPHCGDYFVPRFRLLTWPEGANARRAAREARLTCAQCGALIEERHKSRMNQAGKFLAPGQHVVDGEVVGDAAESDTASFWVSGLMSPWKTFGQRASDWLRAVESGDQERIRGVLNTAFGELYRTQGDAPEWQAVLERAGVYHDGEVPAGVVWLFLTVDVQKDRLVCVVRGWGPEFESWLVHRTELWGETDQPDVWRRLSKLAEAQFGGRTIRASAVDSGFQTDQVYEWVRKHRAFRAYATKGRDNPTKLFSSTPVEAKRDGKKVRQGLDLWTVDHSYFKSWVHDRIGWPPDQPGAWHLPADIDEDYARQIVAEQRMRLPSGRTAWVLASRNNHFLDCEALQAFLAHVEGVRSLGGAQAQARPRRRMRSHGIRGS